MVDKLANTYPTEYSVHLANDNHRIIKGLLAAKLNNNPSLAKLVEIYEQQLVEKDMLKTTKEEVNRLKSVLQMVGSRISL